MLNAPPDPGDDGDGPAIAERLVAGAIGALVGGLAAPWDGGVARQKSLELFALFWCQSSDLVSGVCWFDFTSIASPQRWKR